MRLIYIANMRVPTEKAHGLQIMQNCEALADTGAEVQLWVPRRRNTPALRAVGDPWAYYGVRRNFELRRVPCLDFTPPAAEQAGLPARLVFYVQALTFALAALALALFARADVYYSRDRLALLALSLVKPRRALAYEAHQFSPSRRGRWLERLAARRMGTVIAVTPPLADELVKLGVPVARVLVAHDGFRRERFADLPSQAEARQKIGWPDGLFIVGYVGRLHTMAMDKGVGTLIEALRDVDGAALALVGGPDEMAAALRDRWLALGLDGAHFLYAGQVESGRVPLYLSAFDVCAMPFPFTPHFAFFASPLKLFEYMAAGRAIVASDLPGWADVVQDGQTALLTPPGDAGALAAALTRLRDDPAQRERLGQQARARALDVYTWDARARAILRKIAEAT
ncbi:MAG: glycosyltransferase [Chloroflexi bacterium]|nr:glycosyltransferase [Chloroflexota bacterium]